MMLANVKLDIRGHKRISNGTAKLEILPFLYCKEFMKNSIAKLGKVNKNQ